MAKSKVRIQKKENGSSSSPVPPSASVEGNSVEEVHQDFEENSSDAPNDSSEATSTVHTTTHSHVKGKAHTKRGVARKKKHILEHEDQPSLEVSPVGSPGTVSPTALSLSPGAVSVQGIDLSLENSNDAQHKLLVSNASQNDSRFRPWCRKL